MPRNYQIIEHTDTLICQGTTRSQNTDTLICQGTTRSQNTQTQYTQPQSLETILFPLLLHRLHDHHTLPFQVTWSSYPPFQVTWSSYPPFQVTWSSYPHTSVHTHTNTNTHTHTHTHTQTSAHKQVQIPQKSHAGCVLLLLMAGGTLYNAQIVCMCVWVHVCVCVCMYVCVCMCVYVCVCICVLCVCGGVSMHTYSFWWYYRDKPETGGGGGITSMSIGSCVLVSSL